MAAPYIFAHRINLLCLVAVARSRQLFPLLTVCYILPAAQF
jgi:hypothetical protein